MSVLKTIEDHLAALYGPEQGQVVYQQMLDLPRFQEGLRRTQQSGTRRGAVDQRDALLITYGDQVQSPGQPPLQTLSEFCHQRLTGLVSGIHLLPFYPYSSDDGFSVIDYRQVDPALGDWQDITRFCAPEDGQTSAGFRLMFDAVINHISVESDWFQRFLRDDPRYSSYFHTMAGNPDLSRVVRPRTLPLLTSFETASGKKAVWTTFSADQVDLNYANPQVLLDIIDILLFYAEQGADFIRLDAIAYLWKTIGTACIHLPQTHRVIQLIRAVFDLAAPQVLLITETNVPHADNIAYFGDGFNEAQLVYNFALPPLVLHTLRTGSARALSAWASQLRSPSPAATFFNFLASHDGIGVNPARGILTDAEIDALVNGVLEHAGLVSYKTNPDGSHSPYELNINYFDALSSPLSSEPLDLQVQRFMAAQFIMLSLAGVPGIYFHSLFGSRGWPEGVEQTGRNRTINREKLARALLEAALDDPQSLRARVFSQYAHLLQVRAGQAAFDPNAPQQVLECGPDIFALLRTAPDNHNRLLCLLNVSSQQTSARVDWAASGLPAPAQVTDLLSGRVETWAPDAPIPLAPYQYRWLLLKS